jgi:hypothetical protein
MHIQQKIHINRKDVNSIEFEVQELRIDIDPGEEISFEMDVVNYGTPIHVHFSASNDIRGMVTFLHENPYIKYEERVPVIVRLPKDADKHTEGEIFVATGYGARKNSFSLILNPEKKISPTETGVTVHPARPAKRVAPRKKIESLIKTPEMSEIMAPLITIIIIILSLLLTFFWPAIPQFRFGGALFTSILIVFLIIYSLTRALRI